MTVGDWRLRQTDPERASSKGKRKRSDKKKKRKEKRIPFLRRTSDTEPGDFRAETQNLSWHISPPVSNHSGMESNSEGVRENKRWTKRGMKQKEMI